MEKSDIFNFESVSVDIGDLRATFFRNTPLTDLPQAAPSEVHFHTDFEFQCIIGGEMTLIAENGGEESVFHLSAGDIVLIPPDVLHRNAGGGEVFRRYTLSFSFAPLKGAAEAGAFSEYLAYSRIFGALDRIAVFRSDVISRCADRIIGLDMRPQSFHRLRIYLSVIFTELADITAALAPDQTRPRTGIRGGERGEIERKWRIENYVSLFYGRKNPMDDLTKILHLSRRQTDRVTRSLTGESFSALLTRQRMNAAVIMAAKTRMPFYQIAGEVGYSSYVGFYHAFIRFTGKSPEDYRRGS